MNRLNILIATNFFLLAATGCTQPADSRKEETDVRIAWNRGTYQEITSAKVENKGYTEEELVYPRIKALSDGTLLMTFMNNRYGFDVFVQRSEDGGRTWSNAQMVRQCFDAVSSAGTDKMVFVNPDFIELQDGRILLAYQWRYSKGYGDLAHTNENCGVEIMFSNDKGRTFSEPRRIYTGRCWEPAMLQLPSGEIQMYITDSSETTDSGESLACTALIRSFDGGHTWQGKESCSYLDGEVVSRTIDSIHHRKMDGMPSAVWLDNGYGIAVPLEVWGHVNRADQSPVIVRTDIATNWHSDQSVRANGGPEYPWKKQLNKDFMGFAPYSTKLSTGEMVVLSNGTYKDVNGMWVFIGDKRADNFRFATSPFVGWWGSIDCIGVDRVLGAGTFTYTEGERPRNGVRMMVGRLNRSKTIAKGGITQKPVGEFDREQNSCWFLGKKTSSSVFADFGYTDDCFIVSTYLFDENLLAFAVENSDAPSMLLARQSAEGKWNTYKIIVNAEGRYRIYREENFSWRLIDKGQTEVDLQGTVNNPADTDLGFGARLCIDWNLLGGKPHPDEALRAHLRHHYKDSMNEAIFSRIEDAEGENSDCPEEWLRIRLK